MVAMLKKVANGGYRCTYCHMKQHEPINATCPFCGNIFSNYEEILIKELKARENLELLERCIKGEDKNGKS